MKVKDLIVELQKRNPEGVIYTWDGFYDNTTDEVFLHDMPDGGVEISWINYGKSGGEDDGTDVRKRDTGNATYTVPSPDDEGAL